MFRVQFFNAKSVHIYRNLQCIEQRSCPNVVLETLQWAKENRPKVRPPRLCAHLPVELDDCLGQSRTPTRDQSWGRPWNVWKHDSEWFSGSLEAAVLRTVPERAWTGPRRTYEMVAVYFIQERLSNQAKPNCWPVWERLLNWYGASPKNDRIRASSTASCSMLWPCCDCALK